MCQVRSSGKLKRQNNVRTVFIIVLGLDETRNRYKNNNVRTEFINVSGLVGNLKRQNNLPPTVFINVSALDDISWKSHKNNNVLTKVENQS